MLSHLFAPISIGQVTIRNRVCFLAHRTNFAKKGRVTDRHIAYYERRAMGECGLIIMGEFTIHPDDRPWEAMIEIYKPDAAKDLKRLTNAVHAQGAAIFAQINHHGFQSSGAITRKAIWGPSAVSDIAFGETAKPMEQEDFSVIVEAFSRAAAVAREGGVDGLEVDMGPESLLRQFLSPLSNLREDEYGGSLENRMQLPIEVLRGVRKTVGDDFTVGVRLCVDEQFWGAITPEESLKSAVGFEEEGLADFFNTSVGTYYNLHLFMASMHTPFGFTMEAAERLKATVDSPVMASHQISSPQMAEEILEKGRADMIGMIRNLICDPDMPKKAREGKLDEIRYCVRDNKGCIGRVNNARMLGCIQNPEVSNEILGGVSIPFSVPSKKRIMVIGGGPAGLEAARAARERGHDVIVYEKEAQVGGQINFIKKRPRRKGMGAVINYLRYMLDQFEVTVVTGTEVTAILVKEENPDVVIVATGSRPREKPVPGDYGSPIVLNVWEVLEGQYAIGESVLFIDENGGHHAAATVEFLADQGKIVHMVTSELFIGIELSPLGDLSMTRQRLLQKGVTFTSDVIIDAIEAKRVRGRDRYTNGPIVLQGYDTVVLDMGNRANDEIYRELKGQVNELYRVGDCVAPRGIDMAILEGRKVGEMV